MAEDRIVVLGIRPRAESIRPAGVHLRWMFPPRRGFPAKGFEIYRRRAEHWRAPCQTFQRVGKLKSGDGLGTVRFYFGKEISLSETDGGGLGVALTEALPHQRSAHLLQLHFDPPVARFDLWFETHKEASHRPGRGSVTEFRAYAGNRLAAVAHSDPALSGTVQRVRLSGVMITDVVFSLVYIRALLGLCYQTEAEVLAARDWARVAYLPLAQSPTDALARLEEGLRNRYAADRNAALARYSTPELTQLLGWLNLLQNPNAPDFANPGAPSDQLAFAMPDDSPLRALQPQGLLLLAALDPNIARLLGLYWVDADAQPNGPTPGTAYDYLVNGLAADGPMRGLLLDAGAREAELPKSAEPVVSEQLPGLRWQDQRPLGRVGVRWPRPTAPHELPPPTAPVLFDVMRTTVPPAPVLRPGMTPLDRITLPERTVPAIGIQPRPVLLTGETPVLVPETAWQGNGPLFIDNDVAIGTYRYSVRGIDSFGQMGRPVNAEPLSVKDLEAPPAPVRVQALLRQPGYPWLTPEQRGAHLDSAALEAIFGPGTAWVGAYGRPALLEVTFEFGPRQLDQAPDAHSFLLHWRHDSLIDSSFTAVKSSSAAGTAQIVDIEPPDSSPLSAFEGGTLATEGNLPAAERQLARIAAVLDDRRVRVEGGTFSHGQKVRLRTDPHSRATWTWMKRQIAIRAPTSGQVVGSAAQLTLPARPMAIYDGLIDLALDLALLEPDLLVGGSVSIPGAGSYAIRYSTSGNSAAGEEGAPRVGIDDQGQFASDQPFTLTLNLPPTLRAVQIDGIFDDTPVPLPIAPENVTPAPGGEITFESGGALRIARVVSPVQQGVDAFAVLVHTPEGEFPLPGIVCRYYAPYRVRLVVDTASTPDWDLALPVAPAGTRHAYIALAAQDTRQNVGPLSAPVQITAVRPPPEGAPSAPVFCAEPEASIGYATPPDRQGSATLCLSWDYSAEPNLRFEVARALDNTIIATDRRNWLHGLAEPGLPLLPVTVESVSADALPMITARLAGGTAFGGGALLWQGERRFAIIGEPSLDGDLLTFTVEPDALGPPGVGEAALAPAAVIPGASYAATIEALTPASEGIYRVTLAAALTAPVEGGRLTQNGAIFQVVRAFPPGDLLVRPLHPEMVPSPGNCEIAAPPDYTRVVGDDAQVRHLAAKPENIDAFGLVTGVPIAALTFTDLIPGIGRNRFFYRVRAVDAAENRSEWSAVSVPFYQVDTTPPRPPRLVSALGGDRRAVLRWDRDDAVTEYRVYRARNAEALVSTDPVAVLDPAATAPAEAEITFVDEPVEGLPPGESYLYCVEAIRRVPTSSDPAADIVIMVRSEPAGLHIFDSRPPMPPDSVTIERLPSANGGQVRLRWALADRVRFMVKRGERGQPILQPHSDWLDTATFDAAAGQWVYEYLDQSGVEAARQYVYQIVVASAADRRATSTPFAEA